MRASAKKRRGADSPSKIQMSPTGHMNETFENALNMQ